MQATIVWSSWLLSGIGIPLCTQGPHKTLSSRSKFLFPLSPFFFAECLLPLHPLICPPYFITPTFTSFALTDNPNFITTMEISPGQWLIMVTSGASIFCTAQLISSYLRSKSEKRITPIARMVALKSACDFIVAVKFFLVVLLPSARNDSLWCFIQYTIGQVRAGRARRLKTTRLTLLPCTRPLPHIADGCSSLVLLQFPHWSSSFLCL